MDRYELIDICNYILEYMREALRQMVNANNPVEIEVASMAYDELKECLSNVLDDKGDD